LREAVIVSTARTPIGRAFRGAFNNVKSPTLMGHAIRHAVQRAGADPGEIEDVVIGSVLTAGTAGMNIARNAALAAGLPYSVAAQTMDRQCASGLMAVATAAKQVIVDAMDVVVAGGQENISAVQEPYFEWVQREKDEQVIARAQHAYMPMLRTAEFVARKYGISRDAQDHYALESQQRPAAAQAAGRFDEEIVPTSATMTVVDKATKAVSHKEVTLSKDEGNRAETTLESLQALKPAIEGGVVTAGNACQLSDGASACVLMERSVAERRGLKPLGLYRGMAVAGCEPEEMGLGRSMLFRRC
jgi:acetyl-CoA C-acetyltransferase